jgi:hypothetical protein
MRSSPSMAPISPKGDLLNSEIFIAPGMKSHGEGGGLGAKTF